MWLFPTSLGYGVYAWLSADFACLEAHTVEMETKANPHLMHSPLAKTALNFD